MKDYPVIKFVLLMIAGILLREEFRVDFLAVLALLFVLVILFILSSKFNFFNKISFLISSILIVLIILFGNLLADINRFEPNKFFKEIRTEKNLKIYGKVDNVNLIRTERLDFYIMTDSVSSASFSTVQKVKIICRVFDEQKDLEKLYDIINPGNKIEVTGFYQQGRERRNPGEFDYNEYLRLQNITGLITVSSASEIKILSHEKSFILSELFQVRKAINERIYELHNTQTSSLLRGLLIADRYEINYDLKTQFINAGVMHVLAVSGLHVIYIGMIFIFLFGRFSTNLRTLLTVIGLVAFMLITEVQPSVFRATIMAIVFIAAFITNRDSNLFNSIAISALIILLIDPYEIYSAGFVLSYVAVISIAILYPILDSWINGLNIKSSMLKSFLLFTAVSLSAQIGTIPLTLIYFGKISTVALLTNIVVIPVTGFMISLAIATLFVSIFINPLAAIYASVNDFITDIVVKLILYSGRLDFSHVFVYRYTVFDALIFCFFIAVFLYFNPKFKSPVAKLILLISLTLNTFLYSMLNDDELLPASFVSVMMVDIGQGDAFILKFPNGETALIDAGNVTPNFDNGERIILPLLIHLGIDKIDYAFVSHVDLDHYGGFVSLVFNDKIGKIFKPSIDTSSSKDVKFENYLRNRNIPIEYYNLQKMNFGNTRFYVLNDSIDHQKNNFSDNNRSGLFKIVFGKTSFLFTGDMEKQAEKYYAEKYKDFLEVDLLKVSHHGSTTSSTDIFINFAKPEISLISAGFNNKFGHPKKEILNRLANINSTVYRTDMDKAIIVRSDGEKINLINWNN